MFFRHFTIYPREKKSLEIYEILHLRAESKIGLLFKWIFFRTEMHLRSNAFNGLSYMLFAKNWHEGLAINLFPEELIFEQSVTSQWTFTKIFSQKMSKICSKNRILCFFCPTNPSRSAEKCVECLIFATNTKSSTEKTLLVHVNAIFAGKTPNC